MSNVKTVPGKKMFCGDMDHADEITRDVLGGFQQLQVSGTDVNVSGVIVGATLAADYSPGVDADGLPCTNPDGTFLICIEKVGVFYVTLQDGSDFIITAVQSTSYLGLWYPAKIYSVNVGTTGDFSVGY